MFINIDKIDIYIHDKKELKDTFKLEENKEFSLKSYIQENLSQVLVN